MCYALQTLVLLSYFMKRLFSSIALVSILLPSVAAALSNLPTETTTATVFIVNYNEDNQFKGWGSGFFVDEGIVVTNKHVIEAGDWYRVYATGADEKVDMMCYKKITKSDVRINLDDDVAYMRVFLDCDHGVLDFGDDAWEGDSVSVMGYPYRGSAAASQELAVTSGTVNGFDDVDGWVLTDAPMDIGNSGGPVVSNGDVVGVAVAKGVDEDGNYVTSYYIPGSVILNGLLYANDSRFGYTPRSRSSSSRISSSRSSSSSSRTSSSSSRSSESSCSSSSRSSRRSSAPSFSDVTRALEGYEAILNLRDRGVIDGYADGTFRPDAGINRAEFIKILVAGFRESAVRRDGECFTDVQNEWFAPYVCAAKRLGWIDGYPDGSFGPSLMINRAEAMKIVMEAFGGDMRADTDMPRDVRPGEWFYPFVTAGVEAGIVDANKPFRPAQNLTREDAAIWIEGAE